MITNIKTTLQSNKTNKIQIIESGSLFRKFFIIRRPYLNRRAVGKQSGAVTMKKHFFEENTQPELRSRIYRIETIEPTLGINFAS